MVLLGSLPCFLSGLTARIWGRSAAQCPERPGRGRLIPAAGDVLAEQGKRDRIGGSGRREKNHWGLHTRYDLPSRHPHKAPHWEGTLPVPGQQNPRGQGTSRFLSLFSFIFQAVPAGCSPLPLPLGGGRCRVAPSPTRVTQPSWSPVPLASPESLFSLFGARSLAEVTGSKEG